ncbi:MAG: hypothetical protein LAO07_13700 [Acidobacteriia bacterium]|nr:hypothetical protein [Terriglobia bacterium]
MTGKGHLEKWATGFLAVVCALLILNLAMRGGARAGSPRSTASTLSPGGPRGRAVASRSVDELARYDPAIHLDQLKELQSRPLPKLSRNPFESTVHAAPKQAQAAGAAPAKATPTPPPPPPLKVVGYTEQAGGLREAIVTDEDQIYVVHEGETFAKRYQVLKISPTQVEVTDETTRQNIQLPVPQ